MPFKIGKALVKLRKYLFKRRRLILALLAGVVIGVAIIDYSDSGFRVGYGLVSRRNKTNLLEVFTAVALLLTLYATWEASKEALRQTELTLRPYIRLSWDATYIGDNRIAQGIIDTCIVVTNNGRGLMRKVNYSVKVNGEEVNVRGHSIISPSSPTNMVYGNTDSNRLLGCRNGESYKDENNTIIKREKIVVKGTYRDVEGGQYSFHFVSDVGEQSWFRERRIQKRIN